MRLSSVTLIAAALSSIADSVIAAPRPFHARALEDVNSLSERDLQVDVHSRKSGLALLEREVDDEFGDDLFIRTTQSEAAAARTMASLASSGASTTAELAAFRAEEAAKKAQEAKSKAYELGHLTSGSNHHLDADYCQRQAINHRKEAVCHHKDAARHTEIAEREPSHPGVSKKIAEGSKTEAEASSLRSDHAIAGYEDFIDKIGHIIGKYDSHLAEQYESHRRHDAAQALRDLKEGGR